MAHVRLHGRWQTTSATLAALVLHGTVLVLLIRGMARLPPPPREPTPEVVFAPNPAGADLPQTDPATGRAPSILDPKKEQPSAEQASPPSKLETPKPQPLLPPQEKQAPPVIPDPDPLPEPPIPPVMLPLKPAATRLPRRSPEPKVKPQRTTPVEPDQPPTEFADVPMIPSANTPPPARSTAVSPRWQSSLSAWLQQHKIYPEAAPAQGQEGSVGVRFTVARNGSVEDALVLRSSSFQTLDDAALSLLRGVRVPAFPDTMDQATVTVTVSIKYNIDR